MDSHKLHMLFMSEVREWYIMLFCATNASMVTSDIATPALWSVIAMATSVTGSILSRDIVRVDIIPVVPVKMWQDWFSFV